MSESEANASDQDLRASQPHEPSHDKVLVDAIGYTKGLVALLDSLTEGFQRRGRELEDQRTRLAILQSERRTILQERADFDARITALTTERDRLRATLDTRERELEELQQGTTQIQAALHAQTREMDTLRADFDARITALTTERDGLRATLDTRERELEELQQGTTQIQAALEAQTREIQTLRSGMGEPTRQAEELREIVRTLERQLQRSGQLSARVPVTPLSGESAAATRVRATPQPDAAAFDGLSTNRERTEQVRIDALTTERDGLRGALKDHEREIDRLRQDVARGQASLGEQTREIDALRLGMAETVRQAEEIRKVLQALEEEIESAGRREAVLEQALEEERQKARDAAGRAGQEQQALREDLADAENLLAEARKDIGAGQGSIARLQRAVDEERARSAALHEQMEQQTTELARLHTAIQAVPTLLDELVTVFRGETEPPSETSGAERQESRWLEALVPGPAAGGPGAEALAILRGIREALGDLLPPALGPKVHPPDVATDPAGLQHRARHIADGWRRMVSERTGPARPAHAPLPEQGGPKSGDREPPRIDEAPPIAQPEPAPAAAVAPGASPKVARRPAAPSGTTVECTLSASGTGPASVLRGEITRVNDMGLLAVFEERLPEGAPMVVRFVRSGELVSCLGRVVRIQESAGTAKTHASLHHLIRFESPASTTGEGVRPSVG